MLTKILVAVAALLILFVVIVALRPADFRVTRSAVVPAPPDVVFAQVNDFHRWDAWSPWARIDPQMQQTFEGSPSGKGAIYKWNGNSQVGEGRMEIVESRPHQRINIDLRFMKPFPGICPTEFTFSPEGKGTQVTWTMSGRHTFIPKAVSMFISMDKMIGGQFETGLAQLGAVVEKGSPPARSASSSTPSGKSAAELPAGKAE